MSDNNNENAGNTLRVGVISHREGVNVYAAATEAGVRAQIAEYVSDNWGDLENNVGRDHRDADWTPEPTGDTQTETDDMLIDMYFHDIGNRDNETYFTEEIEIK